MAHARRIRALQTRTGVAFAFAAAGGAAIEQAKRFIFVRPLHTIRHLPRVSVWAGVFRAEDRKSTRLNSSHVAISYAVFCLKKKTASRAVSHGRYQRVE